MQTLRIIWAYKDMIEPGIYIGTDLELVCTEGYLIAFRRNRGANFLESRLLKRTDNMVSCIGVCQSSPAEVEQFRPPRCWRTAFIYDDKISASCQIFQQGQELRYDRPPIYQTFPDAQIGAYLGSSPYFSIKDGMVLAEFGDGVLYSAVLDEVLTEDSFCPTQNPTASAERIGECLHLWSMGFQEEMAEVNGKPTFVGITLNTARHMYIFQITPDSLYCRTARYATSNKGMVFHQNFRQRFEAYMIEDNSEACLPLPIDDALFSSEACVWNSRSVYWSLAEFREDEITLHGCQGDIYPIQRPNR